MSHKTCRVKVDIQILQFSLLCCEFEFKTIRCQYTGQDIDLQLTPETQMLHTPRQRRLMTASELVEARWARPLFTLDQLVTKLVRHPDIERSQTCKRK